MPDDAPMIRLILMYAGPLTQIRQVDPGLSTKIVQFRDAAAIEVSAPNGRRVFLRDYILSDGEVEDGWAAEIEDDAGDIRAVPGTADSAVAALSRAVTANLSEQDRA